MHFWSILTSDRIIRRPDIGEAGPSNWYTPPSRADYVAQSTFPLESYAPLVPNYANTIHAASDAYASAGSEAYGLFPWAIGFFPTACHSTGIPGPYTSVGSFSQTLPLPSTSQGANDTLAGIKQLAAPQQGKAAKTRKINAPLRKSRKASKKSSTTLTSNAAPKTKTFRRYRRNQGYDKDIVPLPANEQL